MNACYHKEYHYIWFSGGNLNGFRDIKPFYEVNWVGHARGGGGGGGGLTVQCY